MKRFVPYAFLVAGLAVLNGCASPSASPTNTDAMIASADALDEAFVAAFNSGDVEAMKNLYWNSPDAVMFPPDAMMAKGIDAIKESCDEMVANMPGAKLELTEHHQMVEGTVVVGYGTWHMTMTGPDGNPMEMAGRYSDVKAERDGKWVYLLDHASVPVPAEEPSM